MSKIDYSFSVIEFRQKLYLPIGQVKKKINWPDIAKYTSPQNAKKVSFTACHSGKLQLACISRRVVLIGLKFFFLMSRIHYNFLKKIHLPVGQVIT